MKFYAKSKPFADAFKIAAAATSKSTTMPVYMGVMVVVSNGKLALHATDLEVQVSVDAETDGETKDGSCVVNAARMSQYLAECHDGDLSFRLEKSVLYVADANGNAEFPTDDPDLFSLAEHAGGSTGVVDGARLAGAFGRVAFAAAKEEGKYAMRGILLSPSDGAFEIVATDGKRLAIDSVSASIKAGQAVLVPPSFASIAQKAFADAAEVQVFVSDNSAALKSDRITLHTRLVEGRFPPYKDILPKKFAAKITANVGGLLHAVTRGSMMTDKETFRCTSTWDAGKGEAEFRSQSPERGRSYDKCKIEGEGATMKDVAFDPKYMREALRALPDDSTVEIGFVSKEKSFVLKQGDYTHLIVPMT